MTDVQQCVTVDLRGGPESFPEELRHPQVLTTQERVKISFYGGYEHFERDTESDDAVYRWIGRTRVAE
ncbi:MAG: hypothetical protein QOE51_1488 [Actinoplanes sp.]|jgi:hypothetical protein|nr:hypothetical protein [Actinoplanes sp.]